MEGKKKVLPLHPLSRTERKFSLSETQDKFIEKTEGSTTSTENEKESVDSFLGKMNKLSGSNWKYVYYTKKSLILAQDER